MRCVIAEFLSVKTKFKVKATKSEFSVEYPQLKFYVTHCDPGIVMIK